MRQIFRYVNLLDLAVVVVVAVAFTMPPREMFATPINSKLSEADYHALALAEARALATPQDPARTEALAGKLGEFGMKDWAVAAALSGSERSQGNPQHWRALLAGSVAYVERLEPKPAFELAGRALSSCEAAGVDACPEHEKVRISLYREHLEAGLASNIDPRKDPEGFRRAGESRLRMIRSNNR